MKNLDAGQVAHVLALQKHLDRHDELLRASRAQYNHYAGGRIEDLPFQRELVNKALARPRLWTAEIATGIGKTVISARVALERAHDGPVIYVCPNRTAVGDQSTGIINKFVRTFDTFAHGRKLALGRVNELSRANDVSFITPYALAYLLQHDGPRTKEMLRRASCLIVDEAHHFPDDSDQELRVYGSIYAAADDLVKDGLTVAMTGTWSRLDGRLVMGTDRPDDVVTVQDAVNLGRCPEIYGVQVITTVSAPRARQRGDLYDLHLAPRERMKYLREVAACMLETRRRYPVPFAAFARTVKDAEEIASAYNRKLLGSELPVGLLTSMTSVFDRLRTVRAIETGQMAGYITCSVGEEALDLPKLEVVHLIRRTRSITRNMQAVGRALRVCKGKRRALVVDYQTMISGIEDRFIGLSCDDLRESTRSDTPRCVNGGPIVTQKTYQHGVLESMSMGDERSIVCVKTSSKTKNQLELLRLAESGASRPMGAEPLAKALSNYTTKSSKVYDPPFAERLFRARPDWATSPYDAEKKKRALLGLAKNNKRRPTTGELGMAAKRYMTASSKSYDQAFCEEIKRIAPGWFKHHRSSEVIAFKKKILSTAATSPRPSGQRWNRIKCLMRTDADFKTKLLAIRPEWTTPRTVSVNRTKERLRSLAVAGEPKPSGSLGDAFSWYCTRPSSNRHDAAFTEQMRKLRPDWFVKSADRVKLELLELARSGAPVPSTHGTKDGRRLYWKLWGYTRVGHKTYDPKFTESLREIQPGWIPVGRRRYFR